MYPLKGDQSPSSTCIFEYWQKDADNQHYTTSQYSLLCVAKPTKRTLFA